ncbi:MAG TPA: CdaR family transcriptional regulator [Epulopiscium sp.]|nr:CdaR family transcriptional regulator [Candidatus Epulonipiscium sp.]
MLKPEECQKIVSRVVNILDRNINIIDLKGVVIASSNPARIGTFHEGGRLCAASGAEVIITEQNKHLYRGCKEGINLPIQYKNKTIGIVGITGNPDEIKSYGLLVKELVELIVQEDESRYTREIHGQALRSFILELIMGTGTKDEEIYMSRAKLLGLRDLRQKVIVVGSINDLAKELEEFDEIKVQEARQKLLEFIKSYYQKEEVITFYLYDESFIMLLPSLEDKKEHLRGLRKQILKEFKIAVNFVISEKCIDYKDYPNNYDKVDRAVVINKNKKNKEDVILIEDYGIQLLIDSISHEDKKQYLDTYGKFFSQTKNKLLDELIETVKVYFENNMNIGNASEVLFVHRNTIGYRINKIKEGFGIDVTKSYECMKLYIAICLNEQPSHE